MTMIQSIRTTLTRLRYRWHLVRHSATELNRRVTVEQQLLDAATGKRTLPDAAECRRLALQLGVPADFNRRGGWSDPPPMPKVPPPRDEHEGFPGDAAAENILTDRNIVEVDVWFSPHSTTVELLIDPRAIHADGVGRHPGRHFVIASLKPEDLRYLLDLCETAGDRYGHE